MSVIVRQFQTIRFIQMISLTFGLFTQVSDSGPHGLLVCLYKERFSLTRILAVFSSKALFRTLKVRGKGPEQCIYDHSKIKFICIWIRILMYFWFKINGVDKDVYCVCTPKI